MRRRFLATLALLALAGFAFVGSAWSSAPLPPVVSEQKAAAAVPVSPSTPDEYRVVRVVDGDTLVVSMGGSDTKVRLIGLDTPEVADPRKPVQCFGREASAQAHRLLEGQAVRLEYDSSQGTPCSAKASKDTCDKYGRTLAYVFLGNGINVNEFMIAQGYGHEYTYRLPYKYQQEFKEAERAAREEKRGLWADPPAGGCASDTKRAAS